MSTAYTSPTNEDLRSIAEQVWASFLDPEGTSPLVSLPPPHPDGEVSASVSVTGAWHGHVVVTCSTGAARHAAAALLGIEGDEIAEADTADALGELANVIGGNVKRLLPGPSALSLPHVVTAPSTRNRWPTAVEICRLAALWLDEPVTVVVMESSRNHEERR